ncbi:MAG: hypothetical protein ACTHZ1_11445 [Sphingobacterium sp.]
MAMDTQTLLGAEIIKTEEDSKTQTLFVTLILENDVSEQPKESRIRFDQVTFYSRSEIQHEGFPVILEISPVVPDIDKSFDLDSSRKRFKIDITSGIIVIEFLHAEMTE